jgi:hypothetical protein
VNAQTKIEAVKGVHRKLSAARRQFHTLKLKKSGKNTFAGYDYFELGDFLVPALQVFDDVGLGATVSFTSDVASLTIVDLDNPEDRIVLTSPMGSAALKGCHEVQNIGAVETYQRRYLWVAALEIVEHDALDATQGRVEPEKKATGHVTEAQLHKLQDKANAVGADLARFCAYFGIASLKEVPADKFDAAMAALDAKAKKAQPEMAK